ncbi:MAG: hypothetical protein CVV27_20115 [Candidatus Melainabacteria bacterium HGW-Melainabacteria-1]|nr:MAG: hypothetical protein CVV27_20115 [Candidatus Melainabacteria bacterium HGW-Melainabacteria-1]
MIDFRYKTAGVAHPLAFIVAAVLAILALLSGCSTIPPSVLEREPSSLLEAAPQLYLRFSGTALRDIARGFDKAELGALAAALGEGGGANAVPSTTMDTTILDGFLARTKTFGAGLRGLGTSSPAMEAVFIGDFPVMSVRLALAFDGNWRRTGDGGYQSTKYPLFIREPEPGLIHAASTRAPPSVPGTALPGYSQPIDLAGKAAYPASFASLAVSDIFIAANDPSIFFAGSLPLEASSIPIGSIIITGRRLYDYPSSSSPLPEPRYLLDILIQMKDEATAKAYKPVVRFIWTAAIGKFFGGNLNANASPLGLEKDVYVVRNIETDAAALRTMIRSSLVRK